MIEDERQAIEFTFSGDKHLRMNFLGQHHDDIKYQLISTTYKAMRECFNGYSLLVDENMKLNQVLFEYLSRHPEDRDLIDQMQEQLNR